MVLGGNLSNDVDDHGSRLHSCSQAQVTNIRTTYTEGTLVHLKVNLWGAVLLGWRCHSGHYEKYRKGVPKTDWWSFKITPNQTSLSPRLQKWVVDSQDLASQVSTGSITEEIETRLRKFSFSGQQCEGRHSLDSPHLQNPAANARLGLCP